MNIPQAARELAREILGELEVADDSGLRVDAIAALITAAFKRCRNEALEEAADKLMNIGLTDLQKKLGYATLGYCSTEIRNLKETE